MAKKIRKYTVYCEKYLWCEDSKEGFLVKYKDHLASKRAAVKAVSAKHRRAMKKLGKQFKQRVKHEDGCLYWHVLGADAGKCTCGLDEILEKL